MRMALGDFNRLANPEADAAVRTRSLRIFRGHSIAIFQIHANLQDQDNDGGGAGQDESTIYYLHTSTPHLHDISISGPYVSLEAIGRQMINNFGPECRQGLETVMECAESGTLGRIQHIASPIGRDANRTKTCGIIKETNATVKASLPGIAYVVLSLAPDLELAGRGVRGPGDSVPVLEMDVHGTFLDEAPANTRARQMATEKANAITNGRIRDLGPRDIFVKTYGVLSGSNFLEMVGVKRDSGLSVTHQPGF